MNCPPSPARRPFQGAFTLIELLIVVSIVAILAALLLPMLGGAKENANSSKCTSNLRQIGAAMDLYVNDHNGNYPPLQDTANNNANWDSLAIDPYLPQRTSAGTSVLRQSVLFICPDAVYVGDVTSDLSRTYSATACMLGINGSFSTPSNRTTFSSMVGTLVLFDGTQSGTYRYAQEEVTWASISGASDLKDNTTAPSYIDYRHRKAFHGLFADGHVDTITCKAAATTVTKLMWTGRDN